MKTIYLAGGCFWGMQKFLDQFDGVVKTEVGYADCGVQYRTGVYYTDDSQLPAIDAAFKTVSEKVGAPLAVEKKPIENFFSAEEYHQKYLDKNPAGYCHIPTHYFSIAKSKKE